MANGIVQIDGSVMEGGGQILRTSTALSVLTKKPVRIYNIRAKRPQPGLRTQHLRGVECLAHAFGGRVEGAKIGSKEIFFYPGEAPENEIKVSIETAGSVALVLQSILLASLKTKKQTDIEIEGGATFGKYAPPLPYVQHVLLPLLRRMGYHAELNIIRHGFYPAGGARVRVRIHPCEELLPVRMKKRGDVESVEAISIASSKLKMPRVAERQSRAVEFMLKRPGYPHAIKTRYVESISNGSGVVLAAKTSEGCIIGADALGEPGKKAEDVGGEAAYNLLRNLESGASVDEHMSDQILPYMALCKKKSVITAAELTGHAETNMFVIGKFLGKEFTIEKSETFVEISTA